VFGGFCLLFFWLHSFSRLGCGLIFVMPVFGVLLWSDFSEVDSACACGCGGFCLESLILAQDERWRRA
jgi:hypothetical protein